MSHDDVELFSSPLVTKQDVIQQVLEINILKSANQSTSHLRTKTEKAWELIMFILINEGIPGKFHLTGKVLMLCQ